MKKPHHPQPPRQPAAAQVEALVGLLNNGRFAEAVAPARSMTAEFPHFWLGWGVLGMALQQLQRSAEALAPTQQATRLMPANAGMHSNLGSVFQDLGKLAEAEACYRQALKLEPAYIQAHINLGSVLLDSGRAAEAEASLRSALLIAPDHPQLHYNLASALAGQGLLHEAEAEYRAAIRLDPRHANAQHNLATTLQALGRLDEAEASYRTTLTIAPGHLDALHNLALLLDAQGRPGQALELARRALHLAATKESKRVMASCLKRLPIEHFDAALQAELVQALTEPWESPSELARTAIALIKLTPPVATCMQALRDAAPAHIPGDALLCALLESALICDPELERFLTQARRLLLAGAAAPTAAIDPAFSSALARQCFINEYVFACGGGEFAQACAARDTLTAALISDAPVSLPLLLATACYFPLHSLPHAERLLTLEWPLPVREVLNAQIVEPEKERALRATIPQLTRIEGEVSRLVQAQYEENPYPRWVRLAGIRGATSIPAYLRQRFPLAPLRAFAPAAPSDILIAGCGTGQHALHAAQRSQGARMLAIDLSLSSLCYAKRKTQERGTEEIEYAQADLLQLGSLTRRFDVIESSGVLHHLADPWQGWRTLLSLLRPGGFMKLGFYSELGRGNVVRIRELIASKGYTASAEDIRRCRQELIALGDKEGFGDILHSPDFYSTSACRDLLFHVQEHRMTWPEIADFISANALQLIGLEIGQDVLAAYRARFPQDPAALDLHNWSQFETEHPDTFAGMYQFWVQSTSPST